MLSLIRRVILYIYIVFTKYQQRTVVLGKLRRKYRPQRDIAYDKPGLPDAVDDTNGVPDGWSEVHSFQAFDRDGNCFHCSFADGPNETKQLYLHTPTCGTLVYTETDQEDNVEDGNTFIPLKKRLKANVVDPMQKWKISYRGHMERDSSDTGEKHTCFVRFHFYWKATGDPYDFWLDTPPWQLAGQCASLGIPDALLLLSTKSVWYEQWGELRGSMTIDDVESRIRMPARRERKYIVSHDAFENQTELAKSEIVEVDRIAHRFSHTTLSFRSGTELQFGNVLFPSLERYYSTRKELNKQNINEENCKLYYLNKDVDVSKTAGKRFFHNNHQAMFYNKYIMDGKQGTGITVKTNVQALTSSNKTEKPESVTTDVPKTDNNVLLVNLEDARCRNKNLVGGKGANLSLLLAFGYNVPPAFCVTTNAFMKVLWDNLDLVESVEEIKSAIREIKLDNLKGACDKAAECFTKCHIDSKVASEIDAKIKAMGSFQRNGVSVRSSAIGEDGEVLSAAGQLDTILGVRSLDEVLEALKQCWSSYFSFQAVEYRRQNGQVIIDGMGVIIQEMIPSEISGVLMTNDPLSGREDRLLLNACLGLGEGVVSGKVEPDTFVVGVEDNGEFFIEKETIGAKLKQVELSPSGGVFIRDCASKIVPCLQRDWICRLCQAGKSIEAKFKLEQEIEFAICNDVLYILQTRPITTLDEETDYDIFHEFDTAALSDKELFTTYNIQEMMPCATTPLTASYFIAVVNDGLTYVDLHLLNGTERVYQPYGFVASCGNKYFLNLLPLYNMAVNGLGGMKTKDFLEIDVLGAERDDVTPEDIINYKGTALNTNWKMIKCLTRKMFITGPKLDQDFIKWEERMQVYAIADDSKDVSKLFWHIDDHRTNLIDTWRLYFHVMVNPYASVIKNILMGGSTTFTQENKEDMSNILIKCGTVSAEVPKAITHLAKAISSGGLSEEFVSLPEEDCLNLLKGNETLKRLLEDFMKRHGHRGICEAELIEKCWSQNPIKLVEALKSILKNGVVERKDDEADESKIAEILNNLKTNISPFNRWLMKKVLLKKLLEKVMYRERGKSLVIKVIGAFKIAYWSLAKMMVMEGRLPEEELLFFLTHREIGELIDTRSPRLIQKAKRRMKIFPRQQATHYEQFSFGFPKPIIEEDREHVGPLMASVVVEGMPVGNGEAIGRACIVTKEEDVSNIKKGDILICQYTDIGWSPYFPLIAGLVTEIGSILSHGAVVARECGIPCVVNVKDATRLLKNGDMVRINGSKGTIEKLPQH